MNSSKFKKIFDDLTSDTRQLTRIVTLLGVLLIVAVISFGSYYYYDRYYQPQQKISEVSIEQAEQAVRVDPQSAEKRLALAETYMLNNRFEDALGIANEIMATYPDNQRAWFVVGIANALNGNPTEAIDPLNRYFEANKDSDMPGLNKALLSAAYYLGDSYLQVSQPNKAIPVLELAVQWSQTDADSMYKLGVAYSDTKQYEKAVNMFHGATTFVPDFTEAYQAMAVTYTLMNKPELALYAQGMEAYSLKNYEKARALLLQSSEAKSDFAPTFAGLGRVYEALNDLPNAKAAYEAALKIDVNNFTASNGIQRVEALLKK